MTSKKIKKLSLGKSRGEIVDDQGETPLFKAVRSNNMKTVVKLVNSGADVNHCNLNAQTVLHLAATRRFVDMVRYLTSVGCNVDECDVSGSTPLIASLVHPSIVLDGADSTSVTPAMLHSQADIVQCLVTAGTDLNMLDEAGESALHAAIRINGAFLGSYDIPRMLVVNGANVNAGHHHTSVYSPFFLACVPARYPGPFHFSIGFVSLLVACGANLHSESWLHEESTQLLEYIPNHFLTFLQFSSKNPQTLQTLCRICIRHLIGTAPVQKVESLPVASRLKDFLQFKEFNINEITVVVP